MQEKRKSASLHVPTHFPIMNIWMKMLAYCFP